MATKRFTRFSMVEDSVEVHQLYEILSEIDRSIDSIQHQDIELEDVVEYLEPLFSQALGMLSAPPLEGNTELQEALHVRSRVYTSLCEQRGKGSESEDSVEERNVRDRLLGSDLEMNTMSRMSQAEQASANVLISLARTREALQNASKNAHGLENQGRMIQTSLNRISSSHSHDSCMLFFVLLIALLVIVILIKNK